MYDVMLLFLAVFPGIYLLRRVYSLDKIEKESTRLLLKIFAFGVFSTVPAIFLEILFEEVLNSGVSDTQSILYLALDNFISIAIVEEYVKYKAMKIATWKSPEFNYRFDAIVYAVTATLGFAVLENILYVFDSENGLMVALMRAVFAVPGHVVYGIFMGYFYAKMKECAVRSDKKGMRVNRFKALFIPILLHGWDDFCLSLEDGVLIGMYIAYLIVLYVVAFKFDKRVAAQDAPIE